jgi:hypothetical protein
MKRLAGEVYGQGAGMDQLSLGVIARSHKENEQRLAIHPLHVERIETGLRRRIYLERGYGERFGVPDGGWRAMSLACAPASNSWQNAMSSCFPSHCPKTLGRCGRARFYGVGHTAFRTRKSPSWASTAG